MFFGDGAPVALGRARLRLSDAAPAREDGGEEEWIVPVAAVARITLRQAEEREPVGFSLPAA
jgi:hypothetical protein